MSVWNRRLIFVLMVVALVGGLFVNEVWAAPAGQSNSNDAGRRAGTVKWFDERKGYGFISEGSRDYYVHYSGIQGEGYRTLEAGQKVKFSVRNGPKGRQAYDVVVIGGTNSQRHIVRHPRPAPGR